MQENNEILFNVALFSLNLSNKINVKCIVCKMEKLRL